VAQAGTSLDLRQQQATTGSTRQMGFWLVLMIVIAVVAIAFAIVSVNGLTTGSNSAAAADHSYDQIETRRGAPAAAPADDVYDLIEKAVRGGSGAAAPTVAQPQFDHAPGKGPLP